MCLISLAAFAPAPSTATVTRSTDTGFTIAQEVELPVAVETAYDVMTGNIGGWWDHSFSGTPAEFYIEAEPGGGFYEIFDDSGDGVLHATVTFAQRGKLLRFIGPLGLAGNAINMVTTYEFAARGNGCVVQLTVDASGHVEKGWPETVDSVWNHFLVERLKPYVESGKYREKKE
jgi:hypothetical protein